MGEKIRAIVVEPGKSAEVREIETTLDAMQAIVGGNVECVSFGDPEDEIDIWCNEDGIALGLPYNRQVRGPFGGVWDLLGTFIVCKQGDGGDSASLNRVEIHGLLFELG